MRISFCMFTVPSFPLFCPRVAIGERGHLEHVPAQPCLETFPSPKANIHWTLTFQATPIYVSKDFHCSIQAFWEKRSASSSDIVDFCKMSVALHMDNHFEGDLSDVVVR